MKNISPELQIRYLIELFQSGKLKEAEKIALTITRKFPNNQLGWKILGTIMAQLGKKTKAVLANKKAVELSPDDAEAQSNLGVSQQELGNLDEAQKRYRKAINLQPNYAQAHYNLGVILQEQNRYKEAVLSYRNLLLYMPKNAVGHNNLGTALKELNKFDEAEKSYNKAIRLKFDYPEAHSNLGNILQIIGKLDKAEKSCKQAITIKPNYSKAHYNLGITYQEMGKVGKAINSFRQAIIHEPDFTEAHNSLGFSYLELGKFNEAQKHISYAISINPKNAIAHYNLGVLFQEIGNSSDTLECYKQAIKLDPKFSNAYLNLFNFYEKTNELEKALSVIENAKGKVIEKKADFLFYEALIHFRKEEYGIAEKLIKRINKDEISINRKTNFLKLKSNLYHHKKQFHQAFESYKAMNDSIISSNDYDIDAAELYYKQQSEKVFELKQLIKQSPYGIKATANWFQPTFLIGFPRSGTTLLDSILRSHSKINVVEEQPIVQKMKSQIELGDFSKIEKIEKIRSSNTEKLSRIYLKELEKYYKLNTNGILIDKLPLNILELPLINKVFPQAKFLLAIRHPFDCVMSCWMQNFKINPAMSNMVNLDRIVDFYCKSMEILSLSQKRYSLEIHKVRYEDLVIDFKGEVTNILKFLDLDWENELLNYHQTAKSREKIKTPSYSQVVKPIYNSASYRWEKYEDKLEQYKSRLAPWIKEYRYLK